MRPSAAGPIDIGALQRYACETFLRMQVPLAAPERRYGDKVAICGAGPASLSCATFLSRLGYHDVTIFERAAHPGGVPSWIPEYRMPYDMLRAEIALAEEAGVKIEYGRSFGQGDLSLESLKSRGFAAAFVGAGVQTPFSLPFLEAVTGKSPNVIAAASFLGQVAAATKNLGGTKPALPKLTGNVLVLGGGDVAFNVAGAALRCGARRATLAFREDMARRPCCQEELLGGLLRYNVELLPNAVPVAVNLERPSDPSSPVASVVLKMADWDRDAAPTYTIGGAAESHVVARCDTLIIAFGSKASPIVPVDATERGLIRVDPETNRTSVPWVFAGGDIIGSNTVVRSVNDGKTAAWAIHKMLHGQAPASPLPPFRTAIDDVDISVDLLGLHFINPFGLSSATPTGSIGQIRRAFEMGWGFAVTKTLVRVPSTNVSPRIGGSPVPAPGAARTGFVNIELVTEKTERYWVEGIKELKRGYPKHVVICSAMAPAEKEEWEHVARTANESGADALELNLSCPHIGKKGFGMLAGQSPEMVEQITRWVRAVTKMPLIIKLTPNITDITAIAAAAKAGGADAVTAINTVSGIMELRPDAHARPSVGSEGRTAFGGISGNMVRPIALKAITAIRRSVPDLPILGTGGCDSAESALQFIHAGASVIQITSAIQNQDYSIIDELVHGLKALLFIKGRPDLSAWRGQLPPHGQLPPLLPRKPIAAVGVPRIRDLVGLATPLITVVPGLELEYQVSLSFSLQLTHSSSRRLFPQVKASVDNDYCLHCGKCYMSCNDTGYHAIEFDPITHKPHITDDCMGCGLCQSVCPGMCITYVKKDKPHVVLRGIPDPSMKLPFDPK